MVVCLPFGCSGETVCPMGTAGTPCAPTFDLVEPPEVPMPGQAGVADAIPMADIGARQSSDIEILGNDIIPTDVIGPDSTELDASSSADLASEDSPVPVDAPPQDTPNESPDSSGESYLRRPSVDPPTWRLDRYAPHVRLA